MLTLFISFLIVIIGLATVMVISSYVLASHYSQAEERLVTQ